MGSALRVLFDSNILIDYLNGVSQARETLARHAAPAISLVTWMEVLVGANDDREEQIIRGFLAQFDLLPITREIAETAVKKRREYRLRLPDALIWATAETHAMVLVTRNTRDFPCNLPGIHVPYEL